MNCFQLVKAVLDELYEEIYEDHGIDTDAIINEKLLYLRSQYRDLERITSIDLDYSNPATRFAYIYCYTTAHANIVFQCLKKIPALRDAFDVEKLNIGCIGGGPGSDILGILKFIDIYSELSCHLKKLTLTICDKEQTWNETWYNIDKMIEARSPFSVSYHFLPIDVTERSALRLVSKIAPADVLTMIYFFSEIYAYREDARGFFEKIFDKMKPGTLLFFVDNSRRTFYKWLDELALSNELDIVVQEDYYNFQIGVDEDKEALCEYYQKFGYPKLTATIAYRVYRKGWPF